MLNIAIAGGGGLGYLFAIQFSQAPYDYSITVLSRSPKTRAAFAQLGVPVFVVDYNDHDSLSLALQDVDLVISTVSGASQRNLINAAGYNRVGTFIPSEFEGPLSRRPTRRDPLGRGSIEAISLLQQWSHSQQMQYTVFSCGIFMERFHPLGIGSFGIGYGDDVDQPGSFIMNINDGWAEYTDRNNRGNTVRICVTSIYDLVRFIRAAVDMGPEDWPREYTMNAERIALRDLVHTCGLVQGREFEHRILRHRDLPTYIERCNQVGDVARAGYYQRLLATAGGRYSFGDATLNAALATHAHLVFEPITIRQWLSTLYP